MGRDFFCAVTGTTHIENEDRLLSDILGHKLFNLWLQDPDEFSQVLQDSAARRSGDSKVERRWRTPSERVLGGLILSEEDIEASLDCVLIAGYNPQDDDPSTPASPRLFCTYEPEEAYQIKKAEHAIAIFDIIPDDIEGLYVSRNRDPNNEGYNIWWPGAAFYITFPAYCILQTVAPELGPTELYRLLMQWEDELSESDGFSESDGSSEIDGSFEIDGSPEGDGSSESNGDWNEIGMPSDIDYGVVTRTFGQYVSRESVCESGDPSWWLDILCDGSRTDDEILEEAWRGQGNLWAFTRPDRFPISQSLGPRFLSRFPVKLNSNGEACCFPPGPHLSSLPLDILFLICEELPLSEMLKAMSLCRAIREKLILNSDGLAYRAMKNINPWFFPAQPIKTPGGTRQREELDWWEQQWESAGRIAVVDIQQKAPWMNYWVECSRSCNMRNRQRIWGIAGQMRELARRHEIS